MPELPNGRINRNQGLILSSAMGSFIASVHSLLGLSEEDAVDFYDELAPRYRNYESDYITFEEIRKGFYLLLGELATKMEEYDASLRP